MECGIEKTKGQFTFPCYVDDERYYNVSYDFIFKDEICKIALFTVNYRTEAIALKVWGNMSFERRQVCSMTGVNITYSDQ